MAFQRKYDSVTCPPEKVGEMVMVWDAKGYVCEGFAAGSYSQSAGGTPFVVLLFKLRELKK